MEDIKKTEFFSLVERLKKENSTLLESKEVKVNDLLIEHYAEEKQCFEFKTFKAWKEKGYIVKKGEKGCIVFSKPISKKDKEEEQEDNEQTSGKGRFYLAYIFGNSQVEPINNLKQ